MSDHLSLIPFLRSLLRPPICGIVADGAAGAEQERDVIKEPLEELDSAQKQSMIRICWNPFPAGYPPPSLQEVQEQFDRTRERIREMEWKALEKLEKKGKGRRPNALRKFIESNF